MNRDDIPVIDGGAATQPRASRCAQPINFQAARQNAHAERVRRQKAEMEEAAAIAAAQAEARVAATAYANGRSHGHRAGWQSGYIAGTHWGIFVGFVLGTMMSATAGWVVVQVHARWPNLLDSLRMLS